MLTTADKNKEYSKSAPTPVTVVTGFLGSGKTTLINHILNSDHGLRIGVVVNDFGSINIDSELISDVNEGMVSLANGCICCVTRNDLISSVLKLAETENGLDHIVIESSGIAYPESVVNALMTPEIRSAILLDGVITMVDAEQTLLFADDEVHKVAEKQIEHANLVVLNKKDLVDKETLRKVHDWIANINSSLQILETSHSKIPIEILLGINGNLASRPINVDELTSDKHREHKYAHNIEFETWTYESREPLSIEALQIFLKHIPKSVYRIKGFIYSAEKPHKRILLQMVGRRATLAVTGNWDEDLQQTRLVFIAKKETINFKAIEGALNECIVIEHMGSQCC